MTLFCFNTKKLADGAQISTFLQSNLQNRAELLIFDAHLLFLYMLNPLNFAVSKNNRIEKDDVIMA